MKVLLDMNLSPALVRELAGRGFDAVHWATSGDVRAPDDVVLSYARKDGRVLLTHDLDFGAILAAGAGAGTGVVILRMQDLSPDRLAPVLSAALRASEDDLQAGAIVVVEESRTRVHVFPLADPPPP